MLLIWSGKGWVVPLCNFVAFFLYAISLTPFDHKGLSLFQDIAVHSVTTLVFGAAVVVFLRRFSYAARTAKPRVLVDVETGQRVVRRKSAGTFFGIPTAKWVWISGVLWVVIAAVGVSGGELR